MASSGIWIGTTIDALTRGSLSSHSAICQSLTAVANATAASGLWRLSTGYGEQSTAASAPAPSTSRCTTPSADAGGGPAAAAARGPPGHRAPTAARGGGRVRGGG